MPAPRSTIAPAASIPAASFASAAGERSKVAGVEERLARLHHLGGVARARHQVHVALAGDVERVALAAAQDRVAEREAAAADRAPKEVDDVREHGGIVAYRGPMEILRFDELRNANNSREFEGADHGGAGVSFFLVDAAPGRGPSLHTHDYAEVFIVLEGQATFRGTDGEREVGAGPVVIVPAGEPHGFKASGERLAPGEHPREPALRDRVARGGGLRLAAAPDAACASP